MDTLKTALISQALGQGFDLVGVALAVESPSAGHFRRWLEAGMAGEMSYLATTAEVRVDPRRLLPGCRSVIAVAMSYHTSQAHSEVLPGRAGISRYAWGRDYHKVLKRRLIRLGRWLADQVPGCSWRACVDTAPVLERAWCAAAGLGWIASNTLLVNRRLGSELFLGLLLTDVVLTPDEPTGEDCGTCRACLDACPAGALVEPRMLDARRCIAYLTIEHRGPIPGALAAAMGAAVLGCDICQNACPFNRGAAVDLNPEFTPAAHRIQPRLEDLENLDEQGYRQWRQGSAMNRVSYDQLRRNLAIARANCYRRGRSTGMAS